MQELVFDKIYNRWQKVSMILLGILSAVYLFYLVRDFIGNEIDLVFLNRQILKITILIMMFYSLYIPFYIKYKPLRDNFNKRKIINKLIKYNLRENGIRIYIFDSINFVKWDDIIRVEELKTGFIIYSSIDSDIFIPRSSFISQTQIDLFCNIIKKYMPEDRVQLVNYGIPERIKTNKFLNNIEEDQVIVEAKLNVIDIFNYNLFVFLTAKLGIFINTITLIIIVKGIFDFFNQNIFNYLVIGFLLVLISFCIIFIRSFYILKYNEFIKGHYTYSVNFNSIKVAKNSEYVEIHYNNINYIKEYFGNIILTLRTGQIYIIPKRTLKKNKENLFIIKKIFKICIDN